MHDRKVSRYMLGLVGLQVANEVPSDRQVRGDRSLLEGLLYPVFADIRQADSRCRSYGVHRMPLGDRDDPHRGREALDLPYSSNLTAHPRKILPNTYKIHSQALYPPPPAFTTAREASGTSSGKLRGSVDGSI